MNEIFDALAQQGGPVGIFSIAVLYVWRRESRRFENHLVRQSARCEEEIKRINEEHNRQIATLLSEYRKIVQDNTRAITSMTTIVQQFMQERDQE